MTAPLPYGPTMTAVLTPLCKAFLLLSRRVSAPLIRTVGGPLLTTPVTGSILLLRTTGEEERSGPRRTTGLHGDRRSGRRGCQRPAQRALVSQRRGRS